MSMNAVFVEVDQAELKRLQKDPDAVESLFEKQTPGMERFAELTGQMQERLRTMGPRMMGDTLARMDPTMRQQLEERLGRTAAAFASGQGAEDLLRLMQGRKERFAKGAEVAAVRPQISLEKAWHGVHYVLCGSVDAGKTPLSQAVLGGTAIGEDDEGFSGYGPARYFTVEEVAAINGALSAADVEAQARERFDAARMNDLKIYPGWQAGDVEWVLDGVRRLRGFYADAARHGRAVVTCLV